MDTLNEAKADIGPITGGGSLWVRHIPYAEEERERSGTLHHQQEIQQNQAQLVGGASICRETCSPNHYLLMYSSESKSSP